MENEVVIHVKVDSDMAKVGLKEVERAAKKEGEAEGVYADNCLAL